MGADSSSLPRRRPDDQVATRDGARVMAGTSYENGRSMRIRSIFVALSAAVALLGVAAASGQPGTTAKAERCSPGIAAAINGRALLTQRDGLQSARRSAVPPLRLSLSPRRAG